MRRHLIVGLAALLFAGPVIAGRGLILNAFGPEQTAMGGADVAVARDSHAINNNPAGLTRIGKGGWDAFLYGYYTFLKHEDSLGNDESVEKRTGSAFGASYATRLESSPDLVFGMGFYGQGGTGIGYESLLTEYGTRDEISSDFTVAKFITGLGWQYSPRLSLGVAAGLAYASGRFKLFPETSDTSDPNRPFFGARFDGGSNVSPNFILGMLYEPTDNLTFGMSYVSRTDISLSGGTLTLNFDALGMGRVKYNDAEVQGLAIPQEWDLGFAWKFRPGWLLAFEFNWLDYSSAIRETVLRARDPSQAAAQASVEQRNPQLWRDQYVYALGLAHEFNARTRLWFGANVENNPIRDETFDPTFNLGQEYAVYAGLRRALGPAWYWTGILEYQKGSTQVSNTPSIPLGERREDTYENVLVLFSVGKAW